ncbi:MAG: carbon starvation protein A [Candidatus Marinimicrobia bacterium]|nr:carbon starvation protein A [Candidatus Neomarinimicrobiota bacterium]
MTTIILVAGILIYILLYLVHGKKLAKIVNCCDDNETPAKTHYDGVDYIPAKKSVLFGHHFASIAGAAPIIGPVLAMAWGWVPAILWVWLGNIFMGAVHDYLAVMASVRYKGKSIQFVASDLISERTGKTFYWLVFFLLVLVIAAFGAVVTGMFISNPAVASSYIFIILSALLLGVMLYRLKWNFYLSTVIGIALLILSMIAGIYFPIKLSWNTWIVILFLYIIIAASIPVNVLLQPRDYLNSWLLYAGLLIGGVAAIFSLHKLTAPAFTAFAPIISNGKPTPFWPAIVLIIACGSLSGFHSLVGSGTTSKQISKESDVLPIGYGSMLSEGLLSTIVIIAIAGFGYGLLKKAGEGLTIQNWAQKYTSSMMTHYPKAEMFTNSYTAMVKSTFLRFIPRKIITVLAGMWVASFALTTLDTTNRLARYTIAEMARPLKKNMHKLYSFLTDKWIASVIPAALGMWLAWSKNFTVLWPSFSTANQLIASIALLTGTIWLKKKIKTDKIKISLIPATILWITVTGAIIWFGTVVLPSTIAESPVTGISVLIIEMVMFILNIIFIIDFIKSYREASRENE